MTRKTNYVVAGTDPGSKYEQAQRLEIPILAEEDLHKLLSAESLLFCGKKASMTARLAYF